MEGTETGALNYPPSGTPTWYEGFFKLLERIRIDKVDAQFLKTHKMAPSNERRFVSGLKFLGLVDNDGNATERMKSLSLVGNELAGNFDKMVRDAYSVLFSKVVDLEKAKADDVINCLRIDYHMAPSTAKQGARIFVFLARKAKMPLSESIADELEAKPRKREIKEKRKKQPKTTKPSHKIGDTEEVGDYVLIPGGMIPLQYGDKFILFLQKGDRKTRQKVAKIAKKWIDTYVEEEEPETREEHDTLR